MPIPKNVHDAAKKRFAEHFGKREYPIVRTASDTHPETNGPVYLFAAVLASAPNNRALEFVFDEDAHLVEAPYARKRLFVPHVPPVPPEIVAAAKVTVNPPVNNLRLGECDKLSEVITVTIPKSSAVAPADIYFLSDNTGSMGSAIAAVQAGGSAIFTALSGIAGLQFGVGSYRDFENVGDPPSVAFQNLQPITNNTVAVNSAISSWSASGGGDGPEAQLFALDQIAQPSGGPIGWRPGVQHIVVWFGDAPGHDPICKAVTGLGYDVTEAEVTAKRCRTTSLCWP